MKVIPEPIDDRKFHEWKESGKSGILLPTAGNKEIEDENHWFKQIIRMKETRLLAY
jgi:hypothetical protein